MRLLFNLTAVEEADNTVGLFCLLLVVCYHDNSATVLAVELVEEVHYLGAHFRVEVTGRFVGKYYLGIACNGTGDGDTLALAAGELRGHVAQTMAQPYALEHLTGPGMACQIGRATSELQSPR